MREGAGADLPVREPRRWTFLEGDLFGRRYREALAWKHRDVEEEADRYLHRPVAALFTSLLVPTRVTANQVTVARTPLGWLAAGFLWLGFFAPAQGAAWFALAAGTLFVYQVLDCADGQLARVRGESSRVGRILDGFLDLVALFPVGVVVALGVFHLFGWLWLAVTVAAMLSMEAHTIVFDKVKHEFLDRVQPAADRTDETDTVASVLEERDRAREHGGWLERSMLAIYLRYLHVQGWLTRAKPTPPRPDLDEAQRAAFRRQHKGTMRLARLLGMGTHMFLIYAAVALMVVDVRAVLVPQVVIAGVLNGVAVVVLVRARGFAGSEAGSTP